MAYNALKNESVDFTVKHGRPKMALEYLTEYNLAPVAGYDQSKELSADQLANLAFATSFDNDQSGYFNPFYSVQQFKELTIGGKQYRMAKDRWDWANFIPASQGRGNSKFFFVGKTAQDVKGKREVIRYLPWSKALNPQSFYLDTKADYKTSADKLTTYALRFKNEKRFGNLEQVAVKYEWVDSSSADQKTLLAPTADANTTALKVTFRYLGENWNGEVESIANDDFWNKDNASDVSRIFPLVGYQQQSSFRNRGVLGRYIAVATQDEYKDDATMSFYISYALMADVNYVDGTTTDTAAGGWWVTKATNAVDGLTLFYPIRLFENE